MNILYVITGLGGGGAEKVVCDLADKMHNFGHQVKIVYLKGRKITVKPQSNDIELIYLGLENLISFYSASVKLKKIINEFKPDVIHSHMVHANLFVRLNRLFVLMPKLICTAHNANEGGYIRMKLYSLTNNFSDLDTNVSKEALERFINIKAFDEKSVAIYNGIDLKKFKFSKKNRGNVINILAVGRLTEQKDYPNFLKALSLLPNKSIISVKIVGDGSERSNIQKLISEYKLENTVEMLGRREDIPQLFSKADIFVLSSLYEGFGLVVAEAMASNTFVVATDCGGVKEVMGGHGILVPPKDSDALAKGILSAINLSDEKICINNSEARNHVSNNFDIDKIVEQWLEVYEK
ncbi:glycosyl transferase [Acinetobacter sp. ANC 4218]|uniref:glycosyltransferase n=1 Tax=Acinetobacter sp. ANC 4218 TaxID=1977880 RepID=UPI000A3428EC|nr:glycosyltransferase [Acinetobacter sp. ANC 4218]OTG71202.1 glycosyl transferase [Acinetobacter sp. ANC 4218]